MILSMFNFIAHNLGTLHKLILINVFDDSWMMIISIMLSHFNVIMHRVPVSLWIISFQMVVSFIFSKRSLLCISAWSTHRSTLTICWLSPLYIESIVNWTILSAATVGVFKFNQWKLLLQRISNTFHFIRRCLIVFTNSIMILRFWFLLVGTWIIRLLYKTIIYLWRSLHYFTLLL